jgi:hypothetical protein
MAGVRKLVLGIELIHDFNFLHELINNATPPTRLQIPINRIGRYQNNND